MTCSNSSRTRWQQLSKLLFPHPAAGPMVGAPILSNGPAAGGSESSRMYSLRYAFHISAISHSKHDRSTHANNSAQQAHIVNIPFPLHGPCYTQAISQNKLEEEVSHNTNRTDLCMHQHKRVTWHHSCISVITLIVIL